MTAGPESSGMHRSGQRLTRRLNERYLALEGQRLKARWEAGTVERENGERENGGTGERENGRTGKRGSVNGRPSRPS